MTVLLAIKQPRYILFLLLLLGFFQGIPQDLGHPFASEILKFKENDKVAPPPQQAILFIGSSSFTIWRDVQDYFPEFTIINRGFGGSTLTDQIRYADQIIFPYYPRQIVIYCGENDLAYSDTISVAVVAERFERLFCLIRSKLPDIRITYVSMKPSPSRWHLTMKFVEANHRIREFMESQQNARFVNIWDGMLDKNNLPDSTLFLDDMLHMNAKGYHIWQKAIEPELINNQ